MHAPQYQVKPLRHVNLYRGNNSGISLMYIEISGVRLIILSSYTISSLTAICTFLFLSVSIFIFLSPLLYFPSDLITSRLGVSQWAQCSFGE